MDGHQQALLHRQQRRQPCRISQEVGLLRPNDHQRRQVVPKAPSDLYGAAPWLLLALSLRIQRLIATRRILHRHRR